MQSNRLVAALGHALGLALVVAVAAPASAQGTAPTISGCPVFPGDNIWNVRVDSLPVDANSAQYVTSIGSGEPLRASFGSGIYEGRTIGIPFVVVPWNQPPVELRFEQFGDEPPVPDESDLGPFPIPADAPIEGGIDSPDDRHVLVVQEGSCTLYELYKAVPNRDGSWSAVGSARYDLTSNALRPADWTSADAAGLPVFPGLVRAEEVASGEIRHALRFTAPRTRREYVWPARHFASQSNDAALPAMGQRFRLKARVDISQFSPANQVILRALQTYGMILADNGSPWFIDGAPNEAWDNDELRELLQLKGSDFEAVDVTSLLLDANSAQIAGPLP